MSVVSEGTPMTNGEVFALLRRRRDERNARGMPPFGLFRSSAPTHSAPAALFLPPPALLQDDPKSASSLSSSFSASLFATPAAAHVSVLFTEVRALRYLCGSAAVSGADVRDWYGPTSAHSLSALRQQSHPKNQRDQSQSQGGQEDQQSQSQGSQRGQDQQGQGGQEDQQDQGQSQGGQEDQQDQGGCSGLPVSAPCRSRPGTEGHVRAVEAQLAEWEAKGRAAERRAAERIRNIWQRSRRRLAGGVQRAKEEEEEVSAQQRMFAHPTTPLAMFSASGASAVRGERDWDEEDAMRIVMARPRSSIDIHRVIDGLYGEDDEANAEEGARLEEEIVQVFAAEEEIN